jgi:hypothetical protein
MGICRAETLDFLGFKKRGVCGKNSGIGVTSPLWVESSNLSRSTLSFFSKNRLELSIFKK